MLPLSRHLRIVCLTVVLSFAFIPASYAGISAHLIHEEYWVGSGYGGNYLNPSPPTSVYVDPAVTNWIAWHNQTTPREAGGQEYVGGEWWLGTDDYFYLTIVNPDGASSKLRMDYNYSNGAWSGTQAVIYGTAADAPDVSRWNGSAWQVIDEGGLFNSFCDTSGAGEYTFSFEFWDGYSGSRGIPDFYLLVDTEDAVAPEPSTLVIWSLLGGLGICVGWWRRRKAT